MISLSENEIHAKRIRLVAAFQTGFLTFGEHRPTGMIAG